MANIKKDKTLVRITVSVDPDDYASIEDMAKKSNLSIAWLIRQAMREYLVNHSNNPAIRIALDQ
jgi:Ribbon-helix-helix protein, copG family